MRHIYILIKRVIHGGLSKLEKWLKLNYFLLLVCCSEEHIYNVNYFIISNIVSNFSNFASVSKE